MPPCSTVPSVVIGTATAMTSPSTLTNVPPASVSSDLMFATGDAPPLLDMVSSGTTAPAMDTVSSDLITDDEVTSVISFEFAIAAATGAMTPDVVSRGKL